MRHLKFAYLLIGIAILALVAGEIELEEVGALVVQVGWGIAVVVGVYFLAFVIDSFTWQMALIGVPLDAVWLYRMWKVRMVGEVFNNVLPAAGMGVLATFALGATACGGPTGPVDTSVQNSGAASVQNSGAASVQNSGAASVQNSGA